MNWETFRFFGPRLGSCFPLNRSLICDDEQPWLYLCLGFWFLVINAAHSIYFPWETRYFPNVGRLWPLPPSAQLGLFGRMGAMVLLPLGLSILGAIRSHVFTSCRLELCHWSDSYGVDSLIVSNCFREGWWLRFLFSYWFPVWLARVSLRHFVSVGIRSQQPTRAHFL